MAQGYKFGGPGSGNNGNFDPNYNSGPTVQGYKYQPGAPLAPDNLSLEIKSHQEASVRWTLPRGQGITSVNVQLFKQQGYSWEKTAEKDFESSTEAVTVTGPLENRALLVRAVNSFGAGQPANIRLE